jgi:hypothetical protein
MGFKDFDLTVTEQNELRARPCSMFLGFRSGLQRRWLMCVYTDLPYSGASSFGGCVSTSGEDLP